MKQAILASLVIFMLISLAEGNNFNENIKIPKGEKIIALTRWNVNKQSLLCVVREKPEIIINAAEGEPAVRRLLIYKNAKSDYKEIYREDIVDELLVSAFQNKDFDGRFFVVWGGRRYLTLVCYAFIEGKVKKVLNQSSDEFPELFYSGARSEIVVTNIYEHRETKTIKISNIFEWNDRDKKYDKKKQIKVKSGQ